MYIWFPNKILAATYGGDKMKVRVTFPVSLTSCQALFESEF